MTVWDELKARGLIAQVTDEEEIKEMVNTICTRMRIPRKVVVGYWKSEEAQKQIATWARVAAGVSSSGE